MQVVGHYDEGDCIGQFVLSGLAQLVDNSSSKHERREYVFASMRSRCDVIDLVRDRAATKAKSLRSGELFAGDDMHDAMVVHIAEAHQFENIGAIAGNGSRSHDHSYNRSYNRSYGGSKRISAVAGSTVSKTIRLTTSPSAMLTEYGPSRIVFSSCGVT